MGTIRKLACLLSLVTILVAGCATGPGVPAPEPVEVAKLAQEIRTFGPEVDPDEAQRLARISYDYARQLRGEYQVTDPPLIHNTKVNMGLRPRGLCFQWADDIEARLRQENFQTLQFHRAIANSDTLLIDHSVVIVSRRGDSMFQGVVLDGWRDGGRLFWAPTLEDPRYDWVPRDVVFAQRRPSEGP
ncbi:MAG: hypothetical protein OEM24_11705 [Paracoccaceae bacterium]|nr:hypothetical protein [Paracoccaceae bacterium]